MIGKIKGKIDELNGQVALIETASGVYYSVFLTPLLMKQFSVGDPIEVYTYLHVKEDSWVLYGFPEKKQSKLFTLFLSVPGIGPKSAYTIISYSSYGEIFEAINTNNVNFFTAIPGIGRKTAQKILLELSSKIGKAFDLGSVTLSPDDKIVADALVSLGFGRSEARQVLAKVQKELSVEEKIKEAMRILTHVKNTT